MKSLAVLASLGMGNRKNSHATPKNAETCPYGFLNIFRS